MEWTQGQLLRALEMSLTLQSHYARCLNDYDGGERMVFKTVDEWLQRLKDMDDFKKP